MIEELEVDENLIHLEYVLLDLDNYKFDREILSMINDLKSLVDRKLYSNFNLLGYDIEEQQMFIRFKLKSE